MENIPNMTLEHYEAMRALGTPYEQCFLTGNSVSMEEFREGYLSVRLAHGPDAEKVFLRAAAWWREQLEAPAAGKFNNGDAYTWPRLKVWSRG